MPCVENSEIPQNPNSTMNGKIGGKTGKIRETISLNSPMDKTNSTISLIENRIPLKDISRYKGNSIEKIAERINFIATKVNSIKSIIKLNNSFPVTKISG